MSKLLLGLSATTAAAVVVTAAVVLAGGGSAQAQTSATLAVFGGTVEVDSGSGAFVPAFDGQLLDEGFTVRTGADGRAEITYFDGSVTRLDHGTTFKITTLQILDNDANSKVIEGEQTSGNTYNRVAELTDSASRFDIATPTATASVEGTTYWIRLNSDGSTSVYVSEGAVVATGSAGAETVPAGQFTTINPDGTVNPPSEIPPDELSSDWIEFNECELDSVGQCVVTTTTTTTTTAATTTTVAPDPTTTTVADTTTTVPPTTTTTNAPTTTTTTVPPTTTTSTTTTVPPTTTTSTTTTVPPTTTTTSITTTTVPATTTTTSITTTTVPATTTTTSTTTTTVPATTTTTSTTTTTVPPTTTTTSTTTTTVPVAAYLEISPNPHEVQTGVAVGYTVEAFDESDNLLYDVTDLGDLAIEPVEDEGADLGEPLWGCDGASCWSHVAGVFVVTATFEQASGEATLTVTAPPTTTTTTTTTTTVPPTTTTTPSGGATYQTLVNPASAPTGWQNTNFDDSGWTTSTGPFSSGSYCSFPTGASSFPLGATVYLRYTFLLPAGATGVSVRGTVDNFATGYFNGTLLGSVSSGSCRQGDIGWAVPDALLNPGGENVLAVMARDDGAVQAYIGLSVTYTTTTAPATTTTTEGEGEGEGEGERIAPASGGDDLPPGWVVALLGLAGLSAIVLDRAATRLRPTLG